MNLTESDIDRFWSKVDVRGADECWEWQAGKDSWGYGKFDIQGGKRAIGAHRAAWMIANGTGIGDGMVVRHACDRPSCCNPAHLLTGTTADNMHDKVARGRQAHNRGCDHGGSKLTEADVVEIRRLLASGSCQTEIGMRFGVSKGAVQAIKAGKSWAWLGDEE